MTLMRPVYRLVNRMEIEDEIERLIAMLDLADGDTDLEPEPDDGCLAGDDGQHPIYREGVAFYGHGEAYPMAPVYGEDQTAGPINMQGIYRDFYRREMEGRA